MKTLLCAIIVLLILLGGLWTTITLMYLSHLYPRATVVVLAVILFIVTLIV